MANVGRIRPLPARGGFGSVVRAWRWLATTLLEQGVRTTIQDGLSTFEHYWFDLRYGTQTRESVPLDVLGIASDKERRSVGYQPTAPALFRRVMRHVPVRRDSVFVDLGCGKGRALLLAARYGFARLVGVELSAKLCAVARRNVEQFRRRTGCTTPIEIMEGDVAEYRIEDDQNVFYLFNPFDEVVLEAMLEQLDASTRRNPRPVWLIYLYPTRRNAIEQQGSFELVGQVRYGTGEILVYRSTRTDRPDERADRRPWA